MDVILDGARGFAFTSPPKDVLGAIVALSEYAQQRGRSILGIRVDGQNIDPAKLVDAFQGKNIEDIRELSVETEDVSKLVSDCLIELESALTELPAACHELAAVFQGSEPQSGFQPFQRLAEIWEHVKSRQYLIAGALGLEFGKLEVNGKCIEAMQEELNRYLSEAAGALESGDLILLGDLLEYELAPRAEQEAQITAILRQQFDQSTR